MLAQQQLMEQVSDDHVMGHDETLRNNLRSVYLQSETTTANVKVRDYGCVESYSSLHACSTSLQRIM